MVSFFGQMEDAIKVFGKMENRMEKELILISRTLEGMVFGIMGKRLSGLRDVFLYNFTYCSKGFILFYVSVRLVFVFKSLVI